MKYRLTGHAIERMREANISEAEVQLTLEQPEGRIWDESAKFIYQRRFLKPNGKPFMLRVVLDEAQFPASVVTIYAASRYARYLR
jgi:hypothetical protein